MNTTSGLRILFAEDDPLVAETLSQVLSLLYGHEVTVAEDGEQALWITASKRNYFDVILTDFHMPGLNGLQWVQAVRQFLPYSGGIVVLSAGLSPALKSEFRLLGISDFLAKPPNLVQFDQTLRDSALLARSPQCAISALSSRGAKGRLDPSAPARMTG